MTETKKEILKFEELEPKLQEMLRKCFEYYLLRVGVKEEEMDDKEEVIKRIEGRLRYVYAWECPICHFYTETIYTMQLVQRILEHYLRCQIKLKRMGKVRKSRKRRIRG